MTTATQEEYDRFVLEMESYTGPTLDHHVELSVADDYIELETWPATEDGEDFDWEKIPQGLADQLMESLAADARWEAEDRYTRRAESGWIDA
jgi:hypothetical protein